MLKWTGEENKNLTLCYFKSNPAEKKDYGNLGRIHLIWYKKQTKLGYFKERLFSWPWNTKNISTAQSWRICLRIPYSNNKETQNTTQVSTTLLLTQKDRKHVVNKKKKLHFYCHGTKTGRKSRNRNRKDL